jgi:hypothetical protein
MLTRYLSPRRNIWLTSILIGVIVALLAGSIQVMVIYHSRSERFDSIIDNVNVYLTEYFSQLEKTMAGLQPLVDQKCENIASGLTARAAFSPNVRAFLLVKDGVAFCSSATGPMNTPLVQLIPHLDTRKAVDMRLLPGTPMMPKNAALAMWVRNPAQRWRFRLNQYQPDTLYSLLRPTERFQQHRAGCQRYRPLHPDQPPY